MTLELTFYGSVGDKDKGELGGVQGLFNDIEKKTRFMLDFGQRPDYTSDYYGFPYKPKSFEALDQSEFLQLYPNIKDIYRHDFEEHRGNKVGSLPLEGILISHGHYDHVGGLSLIRHDMPLYMHPVTKQLLYVWQYVSGRSVNQFIDIHEKLSLGLDKKGRQKWVSGDDAVIGRDIRLFKENIPFKIGDMTITAYLTDHSIPANCSFIIETSAGKIGFSGDIRCRGRYPQDTENFIHALLDKDISYLFWEGSLLHFDHYGTEEDVTNEVAHLIQDRTFAAIAYPPRDFDRIASLYEAAKLTKRMLVIDPAQAKYLQIFNGFNDYPRLDLKYIGIYLPRKSKGIIDREGFPKELIKQDYDEWEQEFLEKSRWNGHQGKMQRVSINDLRDNQDQFLMYAPFASMASILQEIDPKTNSIYIRSHPAPWTPEQEIMEEQQINLLTKYKMYDGPKPDYFTQKYMRKMHQIHVTGHLNIEETREILSKFDIPILPYHCTEPTNHFVNDVAKHTKVIILERGIKHTL